MNIAMRIIFAIYAVQLFLFATGDDLPGGRPEVGCVYLGQKSDRHGILNPEDIDTSICSQLIYIIGPTDNETTEFRFPSLLPWVGNSDESLIPRLVKLKEVNPALKLKYLVSALAFNWALDAPEDANVITNAVKWLNETGFDGLEFPFHHNRADEAADLVCNLESEFRKYGYTVSALLITRHFSKPAHGNEGVISRLARCCNQVTMVIEEHGRNSETFRFAPMNIIKFNVEWMLEGDIPANKIQFSVPVYGAYLTLENPNETGLRSKYIGPGLEYEEIPGWNTIRYKELLRELNNSSLGWTFRRDNVTEEPYAFSSTGLWASYEDTKSISSKARYALDKGLGGIYIVFIDLDDDEGIGGEGRFPLTRAVHNTFTRGNKS